MQNHWSVRLGRRSPQDRRPGTDRSCPARLRPRRGARHSIPGPEQEVRLCRPVLMVTGGISDVVMLRALDNGACGVFLKSSPLAELIQAIRRVMQGETWIDPGLVKILIAGARQDSGKANHESLSARERSVLRCVFEGLSNKEIGQQLDISEGSVKAALQQLFTRTGVRTRSQLVRIAVERHSQDWLNEE